MSSYINFAILTHCAFSIIYLASSQWQRNRWLVLFIAILFLAQLGIFITEENLSFQQKIIIGNPGMILWLLPCMYFFTKELISEKITSKDIVLHFLLGVIFYFIFLFSEISQPKQFFTLLMQGELRYNHALHIVIVLCSSFYYSYSILKLVNLNSIKLRDVYAEETLYISLSWLKYTIWIFLMVITIGFIVMVGSAFFGNVFMPVNAIELSFLLMVMTLTFFSFRQPTLYQDPPQEESNGHNIQDENESDLGNNTKLILETEEVEAIRSRLTSYMNENSPYLDIDIRLPDIAKAIGISSSKFSIYLNEFHQMNFFTFINSYRVKYAAELLKGELNSQYTLEAISRMSGFRSKTTFNTRFKEIMKETPSSYRKRIE